MLRLSHIAALLITAMGLTLYGQGEKYSGEIVYKSGSKDTFNYYWSTLAGDQLPYAERAEDMVSNSLSLPRVRVAGVARIDFLPITKDERKALDQNKVYSIRKATVTFKDATKKQNIFLDVGLVHWKGPNSEGSFEAENIVAAVFK